MELLREAEPGAELPPNQVPLLGVAVGLALVAAMTLAALLSVGGEQFRTSEVTFDPPEPELSRG